jgi:hydroxymethylglutaryl-CoA reductase
MDFQHIDSRIPGFHNLSYAQRQDSLQKKFRFSDQEMNILSGDSGLNLDQASHMVENVIGIHSLPLGIAMNFRINDRDVFIPMVVEEPSVIAGASFMAKLAREAGGFTAKSSSPEMIGQIQVIDISDVEIARQKILENKKALLEKVNDIDPVLKNLGGGPRDIEVRIINDSPIGSFVIVHLIYDVRDAMGANAINSAVEILSPMIEEISGGKVNIRILSNLADKRIATASCSIPVEKLDFGDFRGEDVRDGIINAWAFAAVDPYRAATHNKGIMNGVDAVVIATGNDWRAIEAGAHAYAARNGQYTSLSTWGKNKDGNLIGTLEMPMAVGIVGGATRVHPTAKLAIKLMGVQTANQLAEIIVSVGLAQNLAALRALATEGIQRGHMSLHARQIAIAAGATGTEIERVAAQLVEENLIRIDRAEEILRDQKNKVEKK